jgi:alcohol dehydrogenase
MSISRVFRVSTTIHIGEGASAQAGPEAQRIGAKRVLLVTDAQLAASGAIQPVVASLESAGVAVEVFAEINSEPTLKHINDGVALGVALLAKDKFDPLVACGGGSPIDVAKALSAMSANPGKIQDYMGIDKVPRRGLPIMTVPTTAGTGSEATTFTIIADTERDVKMLIGSAYLLPQIALVDPLLTAKMPKSLTACTGFDALTHAIESYVSVKAQPMTDVLALSAIRLINRNLPEAWAHPDNMAARAATMLGALQAGIAFSNASVGLVHGMSRPIGALFHVAHGISNACLLGLVMEFSVPGNPARYAEIAEAMGGRGIVRRSHRLGDGWRQEGGGSDPHHGSSEFD